MALMMNSNSQAEPSLAVVKAAIRTVVDFPKPGIRFRDVSPLLAQPEAWAVAVKALSEVARGAGVTVLVGIDARGFLMGGALAHHLGLPLVMVRKKGKLPPATVGVSYSLEYGHAEVEMASDAPVAGQNCLILDDLLATGGTALAAVALLRQLGATDVQFAALINLSDLPGTARLEAAGVTVHALCHFTEAE